MMYRTESNIAQQFDPFGTHSNQPHATAAA